MLKYYLSILSTLSIFVKQTTYSATLPNRVPWSVDGAPSSLLTAKINPESLSTLSKNRTTVGVRIHIPAPYPREALSGLAPYRWFRAAATSLQKARALDLQAAKAKKTDTIPSTWCSFAQRGAARVSS